MCRPIAAVVVLVSPVAPAEEILPQHGLAIHGTPRYPPDFPYLQYVNPNAPKGGRLRLAVRGTFDSFNAWIPKGNPASTGSVETLTTQTLDEPNTEYGLIAQTISVPPDRSWVMFDLRPQARWHDGKPITAEDVRWSFETLKTKGQPIYRFYYGNVAKAEVLAKHRIRFEFDERNNRELPVIMGQLPVLPQHYWQDRDFAATTLEPPLGSGPYRVASFEAGRYVVTERVDDYWGAELPINRGQYNFDQIRYDYYRDATVIREALKAGEFDFHRENISKAWALDYDVPAVRDGRLRKEIIPHQRPAGMQAFAMNIRRDLFKDRRVREALGLAFDFEWTNKHLFFGQYERTDSYFENSELEATGLPGEAELRVLEPFREQLPSDVFDRAFQVPKTDGSGWPRDNLRRAFELLADAGWVVRDFKLVNADTGVPFEFEILLGSQAFERIVLPFVRNLGRLGIKAGIRLVDRSQYVNRLRSFDFDMVVSVWGQSESPGNEQRDMWTTAAADSAAARNYVGIRNPVVDALVENLISAPDRQSLVAHSRALDRVLRWQHYVIPNWHSSGSRVLYWNKFSRPEQTPRYGTSIDLWWFDEAKAKQLADRNRSAAASGG